MLIEGDQPPDATPCTNIKFTSGINKKKPNFSNGDLIILKKCF